MVSLLSLLLRRELLGLFTVRLLLPREEVCGLVGLLHELPRLLVLAQRVSELRLDCFLQRLFEVRSSVL